MGDDLDRWIPILLFGFCFGVVGRMFDPLSDSDYSRLPKTGFARAFV
jgi:hypothetical protein